MNAENPPWVLKFISGKYQGGEFALEEGREYVVGRSSECDMVLVEDMISRAHATFVVQNGKVILRDNGSTNGSFVNGERISEQVLNENDRVLLGTSIIKLLRGGEQEDFLGRAAEQARQSADQVADTMRQQVPPAGRARTTVAGMMSGLLEEVPLPDLLQLFSTSRKTGVLRVQAQREARIYLREGRAVYAEFADTPELDPEKVAYRVMAWTEGMFVLEPWEERDFPSEIEMSTEGMMMEAMRILDELENVRSEIKLTDSVAFQTPLKKPLRDLDPDLLDAVQAVINFANVESILCSTDVEDVQMLRRLNKLLDKGFIAVK